jgi:hypothetical protein
MRGARVELKAAGVPWRPVQRGPAAARESLEHNRGWSQGHGLESPCHVAWTFQVPSERRKPDANEGALRLRDDDARPEGAIGSRDGRPQRSRSMTRGGRITLGRRTAERRPIGAWVNERMGLGGG